MAEREYVFDNASVMAQIFPLVKKYGGTKVYILADEKGKGKGYKKRKRKRGEHIDRLFFVDGLLGDRVTDEDLDMALKNLIGIQRGKQSES